MRMLGYEQMTQVQKAVTRAIAACGTINIPIHENFVQAESPALKQDWKLSRFACYLTVMNGDVRNERVAAAQAYFVTLAESFRQYIQQADGVERVLVRGEVSDREKSLSGVVHTHGVVNYGFFQNAGYRGMYNMNLCDIKMAKGVAADKSLLDFMGKTELAAHLFRITQTEEKIRNESIHGQGNLEVAAERVGRRVRQSMIEISGTPPEALPAETDIKQVRSGLKTTNKEFRKLDQKKKPK
jgi:DNA-damage-inducible protein D